MLDQLLDIARGASERILEVYSASETSFSLKDDRSPVTEADLRAEQFIREGLTKHFDLPIVSEETAVDAAERRAWERFWLVDPLDGTKNFLARDGEFTVNIALIDKGEPVLGVVMLPATGEVFHAERGKGAQRISNGVSERIFNGRAGTVDLICATSKFHDSPESDEFCARYGISRKEPYGSSLKLCRLAQGLVDVYPRFGPTSEWDIAAAHCVVKEAGGKVIDLVTKQEMTYNKESLLNNPFIASRNDLSFDSVA